MAEIDVLIPIYNAQDTIESAIQSVLEQTVRDIRLLLVNDGSTDGTAAILETLAQRDPRIQLIHKPNGGIVSALNAGLALVEAPIVARMDQDDLCDPERFAVQRDYLSNNSDCVAVSCSVRHIDTNGQFMGTHSSFHDPADADPHWAPSKEPYLVHPFLMVRTSAFHRVRGYRNAYYAEDADLYWRLSEIGRLANLPDSLGQYRIHADSISGRSVLNGRVMAYGSQLASISAQRRKAKLQDFDFPEDGVSVFKAANSLSRMFEIALDGLSDRETTWLRVAISVKMLELSSYRPYELEAEDIDFIAKGWGFRDVLSPENRNEFEKYYSRSIVRLLKKGLYDHALRLSQPDLMGPTALRLVKSYFSR